MHRLLAFSLVLAALSSCQRAQQKSNAAAPPPPVTVAKALDTELIEWDEFIGRLAAPQAVEIRARVSGYLAEIHFREGSDVKAGDLLFTIDRRPYQAVVDRTQADVERAQVRLELAKMEARRAKALIESKAIAVEEIDQRNQALAEAEASLRSAKATDSQARLDLEFTELRSPISGRIGNVLITQGNLINGGTNNSNASVLTTIVSVDPIHCYLDVDEQSALKYRELRRLGQRASALDEQIPAEMALANEQGYPHKGHIDFVDNRLDPGTGVIRSRALFPNPGGLMAPGFFARVRIPGSGKYRGLLVQDNAVGSDQGKPFLYIVGQDETVKQVPVELGPMHEGMRVVKTGITKDDRIIVNGMALVRNGTKVTVKEELEMKTAMLPAAAASSTKQ
ncbi:efflux RND transporter periplasmic adaptor subunit [Prosthecobacter sp. SYSU 5D2]|uniref:efflux RND transporter periplasmic adaptor subunit n=1 Tax=Prosthecobacter sp. SYSU 5D2 TaxID=3134134 RepID=UPI0031FE74ED